MGPHNWVTTIIRCTRHHRDCVTLCVPVDRAVPDPLRCTPGGGTVGGASGGTTSPLDCPCGGRFDTADLNRRVTDAMRRGLGEWIRRRAVVIEV